MCSDLEGRWACDDPAREAMDYEFNARFDYAREAYGDVVDDCDDYVDSFRRDELDDYEEIDENGVSLDCPGYADDSDIPF